MKSSLQAMVRISEADKALGGRFFQVPDCFDFLGHSSCLFLLALAPIEIGHTGMHHGQGKSVRSRLLGKNRQHVGKGQFRIREFILLCVGDRQVDEGVPHVGVLRSPDFLEQREALPVKRFGVPIPALVLVGDAYFGSNTTANYLWESTLECLYPVRNPANGTVLNAEKAVIGQGITCVRQRLDTLALIAR